MRATSLLLLLALGACGRTADEVTEIATAVSTQTKRSQAWDHYQSGEYHAFTILMEGVAKQSNFDVDWYNLACGYALTGQKEKALDTLALVADRGADFGMQEDEDFASLRGDPRFQAIAAKAAMHEKAEEYLEPYREMAMEHYRSGDYATFVTILEKVAQYSAADVDLYNLACGYALVGRSEEAIATFEKVVARGADFGAAQDEDFASLRGDPRFEALLARSASN